MTKNPLGLTTKPAAEGLDEGYDIIFFFERVNVRSVLRETNLSNVSNSCSVVSFRVPDIAISAGSD